MNSDSGNWGDASNGSDVKKSDGTRPALNTIPWLLIVVAIALAWAIGISDFDPRVEVSNQLVHLPNAEDVHFERSNLEREETAVRVANVQILDFDEDGRNDILVCDIARGSVIWYRNVDNQGWEEHVLGKDLAAPAHATVLDIDQDGDLDVVVSVLGDWRPHDGLIGQVVLLENDEGVFVQHVLLDDVRRVSDVQGGDFDGDGDIDLVVAVFGYARGEVLWLENRGGMRFRDHQLLNRPGVIHVPVGDLDGDGDLDIAAISSQDEEELWALENLGGGQFKPRLLYFTDNYDVGSAGLVMNDLDQDGDLDLILPQGDNLEEPMSWPQPYHGCLWLENQGDWKFSVKPLAQPGQLGLTYAAAVGDVDGDGHKDVVLVSLSDDLDDPGQASAVWLRNDGQQNFSPFRVDRYPTKLVTVACGDLNGDGRDDIVAGSLGLSSFSDAHLQRVAIWLSRKAR